MQRAQPLKYDVDKLDIDKVKNVPTNLSNLKSKQISNDKLVSVPVDLCKLSDVAENGVVKKDVYNAKITNIKNKLGDITNFPTKTTLNAKVNGVKSEMPNITHLAINASLNAKINDFKG